MRIVMLGNGPFAVPTLEALLRSPHAVPLVVVQPLRAAAGRKAAPPSPLRQLAASRGLAIIEPESINTDAARELLATAAPDLLVVADYGQILSRATLGVARLGGINLHASLLPRYRGAAPINWALYQGEIVTGVTVLHMTPELDAGPCLAQVETPIGAAETAPELEARLAALGAPLVLKVIDQLAANTARPILQDAALASRAPRLKKSDGAIDWRRSAVAIANQIRAFDPWPKAFTYWHRAGAAPLRLILGPAQPLPDSSAVEKSAPGIVVVAKGDRLLVATGDGLLAISAAQPEGKRMLATGELLRGYAIRPGDRFGDLP